MEGIQTIYSIKLVQHHHLLSSNYSKVTRYLIMEDIAMKKLFNISVKLFILLIIVMITSVIYAQDTTLTLWVYDDGRLEVLTQLGEEFEAEYGVAVDVQVVTLDEIRNAMSLGAAAGEGPESIYLCNDTLLTA